MERRGQPYWYLRYTRERKLLKLDVAESKADVLTLTFAMAGAPINKKVPGIPTFGMITHSEAGAAAPRILDVVMGP